MGVILRPPVPGDAAAIAAIDAEGLTTGHATFRDAPYDWEGFAGAFLGDRCIALVAEEGSVLGWAGVAPTSPRAVYAGVGEVSLYVAAAARGQGVGHRLLDGLIAASEAAGYWTLTAQIFPENAASLVLHAVHGFRTVGVRERLGRMGYGPLAGRWRDVAMLERRSAAV